MKHLFFTQRAGDTDGASLSVRMFNYLLVIILISAALWLSFYELNYQWNWQDVYKYRGLFVSGWLTTIWISLIALLLSVFIGFIFAIGQHSRFLPFYCFSKIYIELIRGTPLLVQILLFFYVIASAVHLENRYVVGILTLAIFSGAYIAEIFRAGIESIGKSQIDSARAIGFTPVQTFRYVVLPQALRQTLPPLAGQFVSLIKDSSLLSIIAISEFTLNAQQINSSTFSTLESYLPLAIGYLLLTLPISSLTRWLEKRMKYET